LPTMMTLLTEAMALAPAWEIERRL